MRVDDRQYDELRPIKIQKGFIEMAEGSVLIEFGSTKVICTATIEDKVPPFLKDAGQGWVTGEYAMLPRATSSRNVRESARGKLGGRTHEIQRLIGRSLRSVVDMKLLGERTIIVDCDVIQADGGTRTASITGAFIAMADAIKHAMDHGMITKPVINDFIAAVSCGIVDGRAALDLCYKEDYKAEVDMNFVMTGSGEFVELQGTAERRPFGPDALNEMVVLAKKGIAELVEMQRAEIAPSVIK